MELPMRNKKQQSAKRRNARKAKRAMANSARLCDDALIAAEKFENHAFIQSRVLSSRPCRRAAKGSKPTFSQMMPRKHPFRQPIAHSSNGFEGMHTGEPVNPRDILPRKRRC